MVATKTISANRARHASSLEGTLQAQTGCVKRRVCTADLLRGRDLGTGDKEAAESRAMFDKFTQFV